MRFQYRHPKIYDFLIKFIYSKELMGVFSREVGKNQTVFDVAAGYGRIAKYIDSSNSYYGIDLNEIFINHGRSRGLNIEVRDIFEKGSYKQSDVFVLVDIIHHLTKEKLKELFDIVFQYANKRVIVVEPAFVDLQSKYGIWGKLVDRFFRVMDYDGFNKINRWFTDDEYTKLFEGKFGSYYGDNFSIRQQKVSNHYIVIFTKGEHRA